MPCLEGCFSDPDPALRQRTGIFDGGWWLRDSLDEVVLTSSCEEDEVGTCCMVSGTFVGSSIFLPRLSDVTATVSPAAAVLADFNFLIASLAFRGPASAIMGFRKGYAG